MKPLLVLNFARSGGTLLARLLGTDPNVIMVSEVNPIAGISVNNQEIVKPALAMRQQMHAWYGIRLEGEDFKGCIEELLAYCKNNNKKLIIRDWTYIDFFPNEWNCFSPSYQLSKLNWIDNNFTTIALVRNAIDVYLSIGGDLNEFSKNYLSYIKALKENYIFILKYEDIIESPIDAIDQICRQTGITFTCDVSSYQQNMNVTGDVQLANKSRGIRARRIRPMPRKWVALKIRNEINFSSEIQQANQLLGYSIYYDNDYVEPFIGMIMRRLLDKIL